jgi:hypothetical protein
MHSMLHNTQMQQERDDYMWLQRLQFCREDCRTNRELQKHKTFKGWWNNVQGMTDMKLKM